MIVSFSSGERAERVVGLVGPRNQPSDQEVHLSSARDIHVRRHKLDADGRAATAFSMNLDEEL